MIKYVYQVQSAGSAVILCSYNCRAWNSVNKIFFLISQSNRQLLGNRLFCPLVASSSLPCKLPVRFNLPVHPQRPTVLVRPKDQTPVHPNLTFTLCEKWVGIHISFDLVLSGKNAFNIVKIVLESLKTITFEVS